MKGWIKDIGIALIIGILILQLIKPTIVKEHSMIPTLNENDYIFLNKQSYRFKEPEVGDIVVFHTELRQINGKEKMLIKRIIGVPGDEITISEGYVYRNGTMIEEPYIKKEGSTTDLETLIVPEDSLFVLGDNRENSIDSRDGTLGFIEYDKIVGKAFFRLYPFKKIGLL